MAPKQLALEIHGWKQQIAMTQRSADLTERRVSVRLVFIVSGRLRAGKGTCVTAPRPACTVHMPSSAHKPK